MILSAGPKIDSNDLDFEKNGQFIVSPIQIKWKWNMRWIQCRHRIYEWNLQMIFLMFLSLIFAHLFLQANSSHSSAPNLVRVTICSPINLYTNNINRFEKRNPIVDLHQICFVMLFAVERRSYQSIVIQSSSHYP